MQPENHPSALKESSTSRGAIALMQVGGSPHEHFFLPCPVRGQQQGTPAVIARCGG